MSLALRFIFSRNALLLVKATAAITALYFPVENNKGNCKASRSKMLRLKKGTSLTVECVCILKLFLKCQL